ncbi:epoxide hydrolase N-terminal domain-containing protein [Kribbella sp. NPDC056861]|uniref:epoxide hydrolase N-terminal domain-containing protein n=1 Tax=Kribbella sp. NPDC056861 TaxID=3154857 RepID=UPI00343343DE
MCLISSPPRSTSPTRSSPTCAPDSPPPPLDEGNEDWSYGVPAAYLTELVTYWRDGYDWRKSRAPSPASRTSTSGRSPTSLTP